MTRHPSGLVKVESKDRVIFDGFNGEESNARLAAASPEMLHALKRALPWIGKMIADNAHMNSVAPNDCVGAMQEMEAAILKATS